MNPSRRFTESFHIPTRALLLAARGLEREAQKMRKAVGHNPKKRHDA